MDISELIEELQKIKAIDPKIEVLGTVWVDRKPFDEDGTDLSSTETLPFKKEYLKISGGSYLKNGTFKSFKTHDGVKLTIDVDKWDYKGW